MRQSQLFTKTFREAPKDEQALNAKLLERAGFVYKNSAGIYTFLPLGLRVLNKIADIIRKEMNAIGAQEIFMQALVDKKYMELTNRWNLDVGYFAKAKSEKEPGFVLGWSHEEVISAIAAKFIDSYKDLPFAAYQIQTKFRHEARAKSGLLRGREFMMKDLYSFHATQGDLDEYYQEAKKAYNKVFATCGLHAIYTVAEGGVFTEKFTHEFQVVSSVGEDTIYVCQKCKYAENKEITKLRQGDKCPKCSGKINEVNSIEVGNIFDNGTRYSRALNLYFTDKGGVKKPVLMGAYGIGLSRLMAAMVEIHNDKNGIVWPKEAAPFAIHLIVLEGSKVRKAADALYADLQKRGLEVLYDDRNNKTAGEKFADADLIGIPLRIVISEKTLKQNSAELKKRSDSKIKLVKLSYFRKNFVIS